MQKRLILNRVITFCLVVVLSVGFLAVPARADSIEDTTMFNVLEYTTVNDSGTNVFWTSYTNRTIHFTLPFKTWLVYVDLLMDLGGTKPTSISVNVDEFESTAQNLTMKHVSGNIYRFYGYLAARIGNRIEFNITKPEGDSYYEVLSLTVSGRAIYSYEDNVMIFHDNAEVGTWTAGSDRLMYQFAGPSAMGASPTTFSMQYWILNWERYDYFDIVLALHVGAINSVTAYCGNRFLPLEYQVIDTGNNDGSAYMITVRVDLRNLDRTGDDPYVVISGTEKVGANDTYFYSGQGYICQTYINPFIMWIQKIYYDMVAGFDSVVDAIFATANPGQEDQMAGAETQASEMGGLIEDLEEVTKPSIDDIPSDVEDIVDSDAVGLATSGLALLMNNSVLTPLFSLCMVFSVAGYVLFGKR